MIIRAFLVLVAAGVSSSFAQTGDLSHACGDRLEAVGYSTSAAAAFCDRRHAHAIASVFEDARPGDNSSGDCARRLLDAGFHRVNPLVCRYSNIVDPVRSYEAEETAECMERYRPLFTRINFGWNITGPVAFRNERRHQLFSQAPGRTELETQLFWTCRDAQVRMSAETYYRDGYDVMRLDLDLLVGASELNTMSTVRFGLPMAVAALTGADSFQESLDSGNEIIHNETIPAIADSVRQLARPTIEGWSHIIDNPGHALREIGELFEARTETAR